MKQLFTSTFRKTLRQNYNSSSFPIPIKVKILPLWVGVWISHETFHRNSTSKLRWNSFKNCLSGFSLLLVTFLRGTLQRESTSPKTRQQSRINFVGRLHYAWQMTARQAFPYFTRDRGSAKKHRSTTFAYFVPIEISLILRCVLFTSGGMTILLFPPRFKRDFACLFYRSFVRDWCASNGKKRGTSGG